MTPIILASRSPRRKKLLEQINLSFSVMPSSASESYDANERPASIVQILAQRKATEVASGQSRALIIGADTVVAFRNSILEKPASKAEAKGMLSALSGNSHQVFTGVALVKTDSRGNILKHRTFYEQTKVSFGILKASEIEVYVTSGSPMDKAGGYGIQDKWGTLFVEGIEGDYNNVVGFPLFAFYRHLQSFAPECIPNI